MLNHGLPGFGSLTRTLFCVFGIGTCLAASVSADYVDGNNVEYESLDYISATGGQWIVTDITPTCTDRVKMKFRLTETGRTQCLYCSRGTETTQDTFTAFYLNNVVRCDRNANTNTSGETSPTTSEDCVFEANYDTCRFYLNGTQQTATLEAGAYTPGSVLMLFASHRKGSGLSCDIAAADVDNKATYRLYYFELYASGSETPKHRLMPARRKSDSVAGLYDTVTGRFYGPAGNSGLFTTYGSIKNVAARQRYPWNGLVDLHFTLAGDSGVKYETSFTAKDMAGGTNITMATVRKADGAAANAAKESLLPGDYRWVWDAAADLPDGWQGDRVTVTGTAADAAWKSALYMVIDLSSGASSSKYPVSYLCEPPSGGFNVNTYKTTKLVLRKIPAGTFTMGCKATDYPGASASGLHQVTLTKDFYIGVFEFTQKQYSLVVGSNPSSYKGDMRPVEQTTFNGLRGSSQGSTWPTSSAVDSVSLIGKLRTRTGLSGLDLPTEAQWEYACRAGTTTALNSGKNLTGNRSCPNLAAVARYGFNSGEQTGASQDGKGGYKANHTTVGSYAANKWGLYDMHGNVWEWCLDWNGTMPSTAVTDPRGPSNGSSREIRGGCWALSATRCISHYRRAHPPNGGYDATGFRLVVNLDN